MGDSTNPKPAGGAFNAADSFGTLCVSTPDNTRHAEPPRPVAVPIVLSTTYALGTAQNGAALCSQEKDGWLYTRWGNPTTTALTDVVGRLEGGESLAFASGMCAITTTLLALLPAGAHIIAPKSVYGGTHEFLEEMAPDHGIEVTFIDSTDVNNYVTALRPNTRVLYAEVPSNPTTRLTDLPALARVAETCKAVTVCDATFASAYNMRPLEFGIDISVHSATKYYGGHSDVTAGVVTIASKPLFEKIQKYSRILGGILSPFDSYNLLRGIKTLEVRMKQHNENGLAVANYLSQHPKIEQVHYPGLPSHPDHELAKTLMRGFGGMVAFEVRGGAEGGLAVLHNVKVITLAVSLGSVESLIEQAATMTHTMVPAAMRQEAGITDGLVRLSVGLESAADIIADLAQALEHA